MKYKAKCHDCNESAYLVVKCDDRNENANLVVKCDDYNKCANLVVKALVDHHCQSVLGLAASRWVKEAALAGQKC